MMSQYSEGVCGDGAAILKDGQPMTVSQIIAELKGQKQQAGAGDAWQLITESLLAKQPEWLDGLLWISDGVRVWRGRYMWRQGHQPDRFVGEGGNIHAIGLYAAPDVTPKPPSESQPPTPQPEPKALEPVAPNIAHVASVVFDEGVYNVLFLETASQVRLTLHTAAQLNQARVEVADRCMKICEAMAAALINDQTRGDIEIMECRDQIKQLADQLRGGE